MKIATIVLSILLAGTLGGGAYFVTQQHQPIKDAHQLALNRISDLQRNMVDLNSELNQKVAEIEKTQKEKDDKEAEIARVQSAKDSLVNQMQSEIDKNQIQITQLADKLKVSIVDKILFSSGQSEITGEGLEVLERVGNILKTVEEKIIRVEGHTDNIPIRGRLAEKFPSNWELSTARATNVVRFLQEKVEIDPAKLEAVGLGEYQPISANDTKEGQAQNRRIEIALLPIK